MAEIDATRACVVCGTLFARNGKVSMCSDECRATRQREHMRASALRNGHIKGPQQLTCAHCSAPFVGPTNKTFCSAKCKDAERRKTPAYARDQAKWRNKNRDAIRERGKQYKAMVRADRGRGDRSSEYAAKKARALSVINAAMLWVDVQYHMAHAEALAIDAEIDRSRRAQHKAERAARKELAKKPSPDGAQSAYTISLKSSPVAYIAALGRWRAKTLKRKSGLVMIDDGTAGAVAVSLMSIKACLYCACALTDESRTIDHMDPLSKGGAHSASNLCACCSSCNNKKGAKGFMQFVAGLSDKHKRRAVAYYEKLNGFVQQSSLSFGMAA